MKNSQVIAAVSAVALLNAGCSEFIHRSVAGNLHVVTTTHGPSDAELAKNQELSSLVKSGVEQERLGHLDKAEATYRSVLAQDRISLVRLRLAKMLDREGRVTDAMAEYAWIANPPKGVLSSESSDSIVLCRYADLCLGQGMPATAKRIYARSAKNCIDFIGNGLTPVGSGRLDTDRAPLSKIRSDAYYASGVLLLSHGERAPALEKMKLALSLDPSSALAREGYAEALIGGTDWSVSPQAQRWRAEQDATGQLKSAIHARRGARQELFARSSLSYVGDRKIEKYFPYQPDQPVPTPHVPDPVLPAKP